MSVKRKIISSWNILHLALKGGEANILEGNIDRAIILLAIPMMLEMLMESLFAVVDIFFVSKIGVNSIAVVGLTESLLTVVYSMGWGLAMGTTAMVARRVGEKDEEGAGVAAIHAIYLALIISVPLAIPGLVFAEDLLQLMGATEAVVNEGAGYARLIYGSNVIILLLFLINGIFRGAGDAALAMRSLWLANGINMILDPMFIFGIGPFPELGVLGAGTATVIGRAAGIGYQLYHLFNGKNVIKIHRRNWQFRKDIIIKLIRLSAGVTGQFIIGSASWIFMMRIMARFGSIALAGYTLAIRIIVFSILPAWGISNAASTMVGQNLGAGQPDRAEKSVWRTGLLNMLFMGTLMIVYLLFAEKIVRYFTNEEDVITYASRCLSIFSLGYLFFAFGMVIMQAFNGAGDTKTPTILNLFLFWMFQIPFAYFLAITLEFESSGVFWAIVTCESLYTIIGYFLFRRGKWKIVKI